MVFVETSCVTCMPLEHEFEPLFREHSQLLYRTAYSLLDNPADAEDQTIFVRLLRSGLPARLQKIVKGYRYRATGKCFSRHDSSAKAPRTHRQRSLICESFSPAMLFGI